MVIPPGSLISIVTPSLTDQDTRVYTCMHVYTHVYTKFKFTFSTPKCINESCPSMDVMKVEGRWSLKIFEAFEPLRGPKPSIYQKYHIELYKYREVS